MSTTTCLPSAGTRERITALRAEFEQMRQETERRGQEIDQEIRELQRECPHEHTMEDFVQDIAETKLRTFCTDCGAQR